MENTPQLHLDSIRQAWLGDTDSLTKRLRTITHNHIRLTLLFAGWGQPSEDELAQLANYNPAKRYWLREINWVFEDRVWVHSYVVVPDYVKTPEDKDFSNLGESSIGEVLFQDPNLSSSQLVIRQSNDPKHLGAWQRSRILNYYNQPVLVTDVFQDAFFEDVTAFV